jgi:hypothetical protein
MNGRRSDLGPGEPNPWVRGTAGAEPEEVEPEPELPPSPWNHPVDPPPHVVDDQGPAVPFNTGGPVPPWGPDTEVPSLRREPEEPEPRSGGLVKILVPVVAGLAVVALIGVLALKVLGADDEPGTQPTPSASATASSPKTVKQSPKPSRSTYSPPPNAIKVAYGVSVVPAKGWRIWTPEKSGKELVSTDPEGNGFRAFFWVRQKKDVGAEDYVIRIFEGETQDATGTKASQTQHLKCPREVLVECVSITYSTVLPSGVSMRGVVQGFRRVDGVVTAMDFQSRPDYYDDAYADARVMLKSVIASQ